MQLAYLEWSVFLLLLWLIVFFLTPNRRQKMFRMSLGTAPLGLSEPLFYPEYWYPPTLFDLAARTGFDIESIIFSFAIGGLASSMSDIGARSGLESVSPRERHSKGHRYHLLALSCPIWLFLILELLTNLNSIYTVSTGLLGGGVASGLCRPELKVKIINGGLIFALFYFLFFSTMIFVHPSLVHLYWNTDVLTGWEFFGVPFEELMFAFTLGLMWSSLYEHRYWLRPISVE